MDPIEEAAPAPPAIPLPSLSPPGRQEWFHTFFHSATQGMILADLATRILEVNPAFARLLKYSLEELRGRSFLELVDEGDRAQVEAASRQVAEGGIGTNTVVAVWRTKDGDARTIRKVESLIPPSAEAPGALLCFLEDITLQERSKARLMRSEAELAAAQRLAHCGHWSYDLLKRQGLASEELARIYGLDPTDEVSVFDRLYGMTHPDDMQRSWDVVARAIAARGHFSVELRIVRADGDLRHLHIEGEVLLDEQGQPVSLFGVTQDITERKKLEESLECEYAKVKQAQHVAQLGFWERDLKSDRSTWSPGLLELLQLDSSWSSPTLAQFRSLIHPEDRDTVAQAIETAIARLDRLETEFRIHRADGQYRTFLVRAVVDRDAQGCAIRMIGAALDITEHQHAVQQIKDREADLADAQRIAHLGSWEVDLSCGRLTASDEFFRIFQLRPTDKELTLESFEGLIHPDDRERVREAIAYFRETGEAAPIQYRAVMPDGTHKELVARALAFRDAKGQLTRLIGTIQDVTELQEAQRMKEEFLSIASHELRTPLSTIAAPLALLKDHLPDKPEVLALFAIVLRGVQRMKRLVEDILDLERLITGRLPTHFEPISLATLIQQVVEEIRPLGVKHGVTLEIGRVEGVASADALRVSQVLLNLLDNAIAYSPSGATVTVSSIVLDGEIRVSVADRGRGIQPELQAVIFEPFRQGELSATRRKSGVGLGLALARAIIDQHGGRLWVESSPGHGSTFHFTLASAK